MRGFSTESPKLWVFGEYNLDYLIVYLKTEAQIQHNLRQLRETSIQSRPI
jgi:hypothetical protein